MMEKCCTLSAIFKEFVAFLLVSQAAFSVVCRGNWGQSRRRGVVQKAWGQVSLLFA